MIVVLVLVDWLQICRFLTEFYLPEGAFAAPTQDHVAWITQAVAVTSHPAVYLWMFAGATAACATATLYRPIRLFAALLFWFLLHAWDRAFVFYGFHMVVSVVFLLIALSEISRDKNFLKVAGRAFLSLIHLNAGLAKALSPAWQSGEMIERLSRLKLFGFTHSPAATLPLPSWTFVTLAWVIIVVQLGAGLSYFTPKLQRRFAIADSLLHLVSAWLLGLWLFSFLMVTLNFAWMIDPASGSSETRQQV